jgi:RsmE family RNA methyltransferase
VNLILIEPGEVAAGRLVRLSGARARHLIQVLAVAPGDDVRVGVVDGSRGTATVVSIGDGTVELRCTLEEAVPSRPAVDLILALPRPKVMRRLWAQLAAIGVGRIILTNAERVERNYFDTHVLDEDSFRPLLLEGLQQARDTRLPCVSVHRRFRVLVEDELDDLSPGGIRLVAHPAADMRPATIIGAGGADRVLLAAGPEGGWNEFELRLLEAHGFQTVGLGERPLRSDTACVALLALVHDALGERRSGQRTQSGSRAEIAEG